MQAKCYIMTNSNCIGKALCLDIKTKYETYIKMIKEQIQQYIDENKHKQLYLIAWYKLNHYYLTNKG